MMKDLDALEEGFHGIFKKSKGKCGDKLEELRKLTFLVGYFFRSYYPCYRKYSAKHGSWGDSLSGARLLEVFRISGHIVFLSSNGLYRNAFDNIRYALESVVQALYIDNEHPRTSFPTKLEILKEIEGKREYRAQSLIDKLKLGEHKKNLQVEYRELSRLVHPSHEHIKALLKDLKTKEEGVPTTISCKEISNIYESLKRMYDITFFLMVSSCPETIGSLRKDKEFIKGIAAYRLPLLSRMLKINRP